MTVATSPVVDAADHVAWKREDVASNGQYDTSYTLPLTSVVRASLSSDKISVPVNNYSFFAQFRHFTPVPAGAGDSGVSVARLRVLDMLVDRLAELRSQIREGGLANIVGLDDSGAAKAASKAAELRALAASAGSAATAGTRAAMEQLIVQYSATLQATFSAARQRAYGPTIPEDSGSAVLVSTHA